MTHTPDIGRLALALSLSLTLTLTLTRNPNPNLEDIGGLDVEMAEVESVHLLERRADGLDHRRYPCALELVRARLGVRFGSPRVRVRVKGLEVRG